MMTFDIVTLFPDYFSLALKQSLVGKAWDNRLFDIRLINPREFATDKHRTVDDTPFGGGGGMVMKLEPLDRCLTSLGYQKKADGGRINEKQRLVITSAAGRRFEQHLAIELSLADRVTFVCGHYLGIDDRLLELYPIEEVSLGDFILTGGEPAAAVMIDAITRLLPGTLGNFESALEDSYMNQLLGSPCYTRPTEYDGLKVPEVLLSGNHAEITKFRRQEALRKCFTRRPELLDQADLSDDDQRFIDRLKSTKKNT
jgi:tRNA (guanine37-N1)-methyltransferase